MADVTITPARLTPGTATGDLLGAGAGAGSDVNTGETIAITVSGEASVLPALGGEAHLFLFVEEQDGSTATIVFDAGDYPPAMLSHKGSVTVSLAANDAKLIVLEAGRHMQSDGTITGTVTGGVRIKAVRMPAGY